MKEASQHSGGVGFLGLLTLLFIGLKLAGAIDWSWWWVWSPLWIPLAIVVVGWLCLQVSVELRKKR